MLGDVITETFQLVSDAKDKIDKDQVVAKQRFDKNRRRAKSYNVGDLIRIERTIIDNKKTCKQVKETCTKISGSISHQKGSSK